MPKFLPLLLFLLPFFVSCNRYQYSTINSPQLDKNDRNEFVFENDSLVLVYDFMGQDLGPDIFIENKLSVPVYIDWRQSALVVAGHTYSYAPIDVDKYGDPLNNAQQAAVELIPPRATLNRNPMQLAPDYLTTVPKSQMHRARYTAAGVTRWVKAASFTEATTPLRFRTYITCTVGAIDGQPLTFDHNFYISDVMSTVSNPVNIFQNGNHGNQFYSSKITQGGAVGAALLSGVLVGGYLLVEAVRIGVLPE